MSINNFNDKVAVITGGASDIGKAVALELMKYGARVILLDINGEELNKFESENKSIKYPIETQIVDMTSPKLIKKSFEKIINTYAKIDYVFNIVGFGLVGEVKDMKLQDWQSIVNTNLNGVLYPTIQAYEYMTEQGFGHIVNMSSLGGIVPSPFNTAYATTKYGIVGFSTSLREEGKAYGVNVSVVCAGGIRTKLWSSLRLINVQRDKFNKLVPQSTLIVPSKAAKIILRQITKNKGMIVFPLFAKVSYFIYKYLPFLYNIGIKFSIKSLRSIQEK